MQSFDAPEFDPAFGRRLPPLQVEAAAEYALGFPAVMAVTLLNADSRSRWLRLASVDLFGGPGPLGFTFESSDGQVSRIPPRPDRPNQRRFSLAPQSDRRLLYDLAELNPLLPPGPYRMTVSYHDSGRSVEADPVAVRISWSSDEDYQAAQALRGDNDFGQPRWRHFVRDNWRTVDASKLSPAGRRALAYYLFLHRAAYGPDSIGDLDPAALQEFADGPLEGEAAVMRCEILSARGDEAATASQAAEVRARWPGLEWRLSEIQEGRGFLWELRSDGAERTWARPDVQPYVGY